MADDFVMHRRGLNPWDDPIKGSVKRIDNRIARHRMKERTRERVRQAELEVDELLISIFGNPYHTRRIRATA